ncbi:MAG: class I SAM-dependent methyltransferase [Thaumarchaeota archaeon]|nr:class I SAM-dependent methyltransferase [Nitrososphaerota archaeon]
METEGYKEIWKKNESLESVSKRIHDGVPIEKLFERALGYQNTMFERFFPYAKPSDNDTVMELGSGVGWIMQAVVEKYPNILEIIGLDISENMIKRAKERWNHPKAKIVLYDGLKIIKAYIGIITIHLMNYTFYFLR